MGVTFDYILEKYNFEYISKEKVNGHKIIIFSNDYKDFIQWLQSEGLYEEYIKERDKDIPIKEGQYNIFDYLGGNKWIRLLGRIQIRCFGLNNVTLKKVLFLGRGLRKL